MPELKNPKHEKFCRLRASGMTQGKAYASAYDREASRMTGASGAKLQARPDVKARVTELQAEKAIVDGFDVVDGEVDPKLIISALLKNLNRSLEVGNAAGANRAAELLGKTVQMFQTSRDSSRFGNEPDHKFDRMSADEIRTWMVRTIEKLCPDLKVIKKRAPSEVERGEDRAALVSHFVSQLKKVDPEIKVIDPKEAQAKPTEDDGTASSGLH